MTVETWLTESECVSSKSSPWQSIALANAAFGAGSAASSPITVACASPAELGHRRASLGRDAERVRGQAAAERVEQVELRGLDDVAGDVLEASRAGRAVGRVVCCSAGHRQTVQSVVGCRERVGAPRARRACRP